MQCTSNIESYQVALLLMKKLRHRWVSDLLEVKKWWKWNSHRGSVDSEPRVWPDGVWARGWQRWVAATVSGGSLPSALELLACAPVQGPDRSVPGGGTPQGRVGSEGLEGRGQPSDPGSRAACVSAPARAPLLFAHSSAGQQAPWWPWPPPCGTREQGTSTHQHEAPGVPSFCQPLRGGERQPVEGSPGPCAASDRGWQSRRPEGGRLWCLLFSPSPLSPGASVLRSSDRQSAKRAGSEQEEDGDDEHFLTRLCRLWTKQ